MKNFILLLAFILYAPNGSCTQESEIKVISSLFDPVIQKKYQLFLVDLYGVVHDGEKLINSHLPEVLRDLRRQGKKVVFLSNAPRSAAFTKEQLRSFGLPDDELEVVTSGELVREQFASPSDSVFKKLDRRFFSISGRGNQDFLKDVHHAFCPVSEVKEADFVLLTRTLQPGESIEALKPILEEALKYGLPIICVNPDITVISQGHVKQTAGYIAKKYEELGGRVFYYGKPYPAIYEHAISKYGIPKERVVMVGDSVRTDVAGAEAAGVASILVLSGVSGRDASSNPREALKHLERETSKPTYILDYLH